MHVRAREEGGFGLIELLMAMTILNIGILAIVAAFNAGAVTIRRATEVTTASVLADRQMELYRALTYDQIALDPSAVSSADSTYKCDSALGSSCSTVPDVVITPTPSPACTTAACTPTQTVTGPDRHVYRIDTYICNSTSTPPASPSPWPCPPPSGTRTLKQVTVVVRDKNFNKVYARETSTFDCSTGQPTPTSCP